MALQLFKIASTTVETPQSSITFGSIPQGYTDLILKVSARGTGTAANQTAYLQFNGDTGANYSCKYLYGDGASAASATSTSYVFIGSAADNGATANTFNNGEVYVPNYTSSNYKSISTDVVRENNATSTYATTTLYASLWTNTAAITSMTAYIFAGSFNTGSTFTLYGVL